MDLPIRASGRRMETHPFCLQSGSQTMKSTDRKLMELRYQVDWILRRLDALLAAKKEIIRENFLFFLLIMSLSLFHIQFKVNIGSAHPVPPLSTTRLSTYFAYLYLSGWAGVKPITENQTIFNLVANSIPRNSVPMFSYPSDQQKLGEENLSLPCPTNKINP